LNLDRKTLLTLGAFYLVMVLVAAVTIYLGESMPEPKTIKASESDPGWREIDVTVLR
jgi:hypothetical protein